MSAGTPPTLPIVPRVRVAMHLLVSNGPNGKEAKVTVLEMKEGVALSIDGDSSGIGVKSIKLTLNEAAKVAEHLRLMSARVRDRNRKGRP